MQTKDSANSEYALHLSGILVLVVVGALLTFIAYEQDTLPALVALLSVINLTIFLVFTSAWSDHKRSRRQVLLWVEAASIVTLYLLIDNSGVAILSIVWIVQATEIYSSRTANLLLIATILTFTATQVFHNYPDNMLGVFFSAITLGLFHAFALSATRRTIRERELREQTAALNRELIATRDLLSQSTRQSERIRIARELHDLLGHHMTALILNLEVAAHHCEGEAQEKVEQSQSLAKLLLSDLRTAVSELREDDSINLQQAVDKLIADIPRLRFDVDFSTAPEIKNVEQAETLLRCIQESVTNVIKHSTADHCQIRLAGTDDACTLTVSDNGKAGGEINPGNGLKGMDERVAANGGRLSWQQNPGGFSLQVQLPAVSS
ncbi:MAG: sensor histidine kinase [Gammaproteobacteria bacterium]|nr:sensor histidine kinase [Gammaproteobacteria bacterium]